MEEIQVFFEVVAVREDETRVFGPYSKLSHAKMALKQNRFLRWWIDGGATARARKVTRTFTDQVETVEL